MRPSSPSVSSSMRERLRTLVTSAMKRARSSSPFTAVTSWKTFTACVIMPSTSSIGVALRVDQRSSPVARMR